MGNKHRHLSAVFAAVENLLCLVIIWVKINLGLAENGTFVAYQVVAIDSCRCRKTGEAVKGFCILTLAAKATSRANSR